MRDNVRSIIREKVGMSVLCKAMYLNLGKQSQKKQYKHLIATHPCIWKEYCRACDLERKSLWKNEDNWEKSTNSVALFYLETSSYN